MISIRINLKLFRIKNRLTQNEMADRLNISRSTYVNIENGKSDCTLKFFNSLQREFGIKDEDMWELTKKGDE